MAAKRTPNLARPSSRTGAGLALALIVFAAGCEAPFSPAAPAGMDGPGRSEDPSAVSSLMDDEEIFWAVGEGGTALVAIDVTTGAATIVGSTGYPQTWGGTFGPDGTFWTITDAFSESSSALATVDLETGAATPVALLGTGNVVAIAAGSDGTLYAAGFNREFYQVDTESGALTSPGALDFFEVVDLAFAPDGTLWGVDMSGGLHTIDPSSGASNPGSTITGANGALGGIAFHADGDLYATSWDSEGRLYQVDPTTGEATEIGDGLGVSFPHGGGFKPAVTELQPAPDLGLEDEIQAMVDFFDDELLAGNLVASGPGASSQRRRNIHALRNMLVEAQNLIQEGHLDDACGQLRQAYRRTDDTARPPDFVEGPAAAALSEKILDIMASLGCS